MKKLILRLKAIYRILTNNHWIVFVINKDNLIKMLTEKEYEVNILFHGLQPYGVWKIVKDISLEKDDNDMILDKAKFEAEAELNKSKK